MKLEDRTVFGHGAVAGVVQEVVEVVTGGEDLGLAGDEDGAHLRVLFGVEQGVGHGRIHGAGDGVLAFEAVEFDGEDAVGFVGLDGHVSVSVVFLGTDERVGTSAHPTIR